MIQELCAIMKGGLCKTLPEKRAGGAIESLLGKEPPRTPIRDVRGDQVLGTVLYVLIEHGFNP
jgi:hypothetical protein